MQFFSRRNKVYLVDNIIHKHFNNENAFYQEIENLNFLIEKTIKVPKIISYCFPVLYLEYIDGKNFCDIVDTVDDNQIYSIYNWLKGYHSATNSLRGDINLRNFIITKDNITFGVDFEEKMSQGDFEKDFGRIIAFIATYSPFFNDSKAAFSSKLLNQFNNDNADVEKIAYYYYEEIELMKARRKCDDDFPEKARDFYNRIII